MLYTRRFALSAPATARAAVGFPIVAHTAAWLVGGATLAIIVAGAVALRLAQAPPAPEVPAAERAVVPPAAGPRISGAVLAAGRLPDSVDMVLVVDKAAELRLTPLGSGLAAALGAQGSLDEVQEAWAALAKQLGYTEREALDNLLGRRLVIASRAVTGDPTQQRWAVMSDVSRETERRIKDRLEAAPRSIDAGHQILSIERGRFELTSHRARPDDPAASRDSVTLVMGPAGESEMFDELVGVLAGGTSRPLAATDALARAAQAGPAEVLFLARLNARSAPDRGPWSDFVVLAGRRAGLGDEADRTWTTRVLVRDSQRRLALDAVPPTSDAPFVALSGGSLLTVLQAAPLSAVFGEGSAMGSMFAALPLPARAQPLASGRQALSVRRVGERGRLACTIAVETSSVGELAGPMDASMSRGIQSVEQSLGVAAPAPRDFAGILPRAARVVDITVPEFSPLRTITTEPVSVAWSYPSVDAGDTPAAAAGSWGWWAVTLVQSRAGDRPTPAQVLASESAALLTEGTRVETGLDGRVSRWVLLATMRPSALEALLPAAVPDFRSLRSTFRRFEAFDARLSITDEGDVQGDVTFRLLPGDAGPGVDPAGAPTSDPALTKPE